MLPSGQTLLRNLQTAFQFIINTQGPLTAALPANGGSFVADGATPVTVADTNVTANSVILIYLLTVGGTVGTLPSVKTKTAGTGFTVAGEASDTSTYGYLILG